MTSLTEAQLTKLFELSKQACLESTFESPRRDEKEEHYTSRVVLPWMEKWSRSMKIDNFFVRGDGGSSTAPIRWQHFYVYPDITLSEHHSKHIALEVKILRSAEDGGNFAKAIGQAVMYHFGGYRYSLALIFDRRFDNYDENPLICDQLIEVSESTFVAVYSPATNQFQR